MLPPQQIEPELLRRLQIGITRAEVSNLFGRCHGSARWLSGLCALFVQLSTVIAQAPAGSVVRLDKRGADHVLRNGEPYFVKGVGGTGSLEALAAAGPPPACDLGGPLPVAHRRGTIGPCRDASEPCWRSGCWLW
jgi:hypothetical protein